MALFLYPKAMDFFMCWLYILQFYEILGQIVSLEYVGSPLYSIVAEKEVVRSARLQ